MPGARKGTVGVYDQPPAWRRRLPMIIGVVLAVLISVLLYVFVLG